MARANLASICLALSLPASAALVVHRTPMHAPSLRGLPRHPAPYAQQPVGRTALTDEGYTYEMEEFQRYGGSSAWLTNLLTTSKSLVLERISGHLIATILVAVFVSILFGAAQQGMLPQEAADAVFACKLPALPHEAVGSIIGLLLAFRTGQAYDRFWEARTLWDGVYSSTRSIVRLTTAAARSPAEAALPSKAEEESSLRLATLVVGLTAAFPYALKQHLRGERNARELIEAATSAASCPRRSPLAKQLAAAAKQPNVPLAIVESLTRASLPMQRIYGELVWLQLDAQTNECLSIIGKAERIKGTPVPLSYSRHTSRFFSVYAFTLPFALVGEQQNLWLIPPIVAVISWVIYATEEIGHIIEEPFGRGLVDDPDAQPAAQAESGGQQPLQLEVLPLGRYCADIASDAATIFSASPTSLDEMPGGDDELDLFDDDA